MDRVRVRITGAVGPGHGQGIVTRICHRGIQTGARQVQVIAVGKTPALSVIVIAVLLPQPWS
ncbi:hypothetical protein JF525_004727 [Salmonella enterica]|nr:hypothetical protein [Salmonella enterica]